MSAKDFARSEMTLAGFSESEITTMQQILALFFGAWDSGGAVWAMAPVLQRLVAQKFLTPLTGDDAEWMDVSEYSGEPMWQNRRCSTVFKNSERAYDIDAEGRPSITFPYWPDKSDVSSPVIEFDLPLKGGR